jgi:hypothetical protein
MFGLIGTAIDILLIFLAIPFLLFIGMILIIYLFDKTDYQKEEEKNRKILMEAENKRKAKKTKKVKKGTK